MSAGQANMPCLVDLTVRCTLVYVGSGCLEYTDMYEYIAARVHFSMAWWAALNKHLCRHSVPVLTVAWNATALHQPAQCAPKDDQFGGEMGSTPHDKKVFLSMRKLDDGTGAYEPSSPGKEFATRAVERFATIALNELAS